MQVLQAEARILDLAGRGRGGGYGKVDHRVHAAMTRGRDEVCEVIQRKPARPAP